MPVLPKGYKKCRKNRETGAIFPAKSGWPDTKNFIYGYKDPTGAFHEGKLKRGVVSVTKMLPKSKDKKGKVKITYVTEVDAKSGGGQSTTLAASMNPSDFEKQFAETISKAMKEHTRSAVMKIRLELLHAFNDAFQAVFKEYMEVKS